MTSKANVKYSAPALDKGLDILECLAAASAPQMQSELTQALGRTQSEIYRMLECLVHRGYLAKDESTGAYSLTLKLYALGHRQNRVSRIRQAATGPMEELAERTGHSCHLCLPHGTEVLVVMERLPSRTVCLAIGEGSIISLSQSASGFMILSRLPDEASRRKLLDQDAEFRKMKANARQQILEDVKALSRKDWLVASSRITPGGLDLLVPVGVPETDAFGALAVSYVEGKTNRSVRKRHLESLLACAERINRNLGLIS